MQFNPAAIDARTKDLRATVDHAYRDLLAGGITEKMFNQIVDRAEGEAEQLRTARRTRSKALRYASGADSAEFTSAHGTTRTKGYSHEKWRPPSPLDLSTAQWKSLFDAAVSKSRFAVNVGEPGLGSKMMDGGNGNIHAKAASAEGTPGSLLPPILLPAAFTERYEPDRLFAHLPGMSSEGQWVSYLQHVDNTAPAAPTPELSTIPDVGMNIVSKQVTFTKIAAMATFSRELLDDFAGDFMAFVPSELGRAVIDAETDFIVNNESTDNNESLGLLYTPGVLTLNASSVDTPIDAVVQGIAQIRSGTSYGVADLIAMHPDTWAALRLQKATTGLYILDQMQPDDLGQSRDTFFGVRVVQNTHIPPTVAIVMDASISCIAWTRMGMEIQSNWAGDTEFSEFSWSFRAVERVAIGVQRPTGICVVSNLPEVGGGS